MRRQVMNLIFLALATFFASAFVVNADTAQSFGTGWTAQYYNNTTLSGAPVASESLTGGVNFNWGLGSPMPGVVNDDNFSVRYTSTQFLPGGFYTFVASSDDGIRVYINNTLFLDQFVGRAFETNTFSVLLGGEGGAGGTFPITVEYYDARGDAAVQLQWYLANAVTGSISGTVQDSAGVPLANIPIGTTVGNFAACTNASGHYTINVPVDVDVRLFAGGTPNPCPGASTTYVAEWWQEKVFYFQSTPILVTSATPAVNNVNFTLDVGGTVTGTVRDQITNLPLANVSVAVSVDYFQVTTCSDANGGYTIANLPLNTTFRVLAGGNTACGGAFYAQEWWQETFYYDQAIQFTFETDAQTLSDIDFTLLPTGTISGVVEDATGAPLANIPVDLDAGGYGVCTNADGEYTITAPIDTAFKIYAGGDANFCGGGNSIRYIREWWQEKLLYDDATPITLSVAAPNAPNVNFTLDVGGTLTGTVKNQATNQPAPYVTVVVDYGNYWLEQCADASGQYTITAAPLNLPFRVRSGGNLNCGGALYAEEYWQETRFYDQATLLTFTPQLMTINNIDFTLAPAGIISGTVTDTNGTPLVNIGVDLDVGYYGACSDANGHYSIVAPLNTAFKIYSGGAYNFCNGGSQLYLEEWWQEQSAFSDATPITLTAVTPNAANTNFTLDVGGVVTGTVTNEITSQPVSQVAVVVEYGNYGFERCTDSNGQYTITGLPLNLPFRVHSGGNLNCGGALYAEEYWQETRFYDQATLLTFTPQVMTINNIDFTLAPAGIISGTVTDTNGTPLVNIGVDLDVGYYGACSDANGHYSIVAPQNTPFKIYAGGPFNFCNGGPQIYLEEWWQEQSSFSDATPITLTTVTPNAANTNFTLGLSATVHVTLNLQGRQPKPHASWVTPVHFTLTPIAGTLPIVDQTISTDQNGVFQSVGIAPGTYRLWVKPDTALASAQTVTLVAGDNAITLSVSLREGDADGNGLINITDFSILATAFGKTSGQVGYNAAVDFNKDGIINISDFSLLATNFGQSDSSP